MADVKDTVLRLLTPDGLRRNCPHAGREDRCCLFSQTWPACDWATKLAAAGGRLVGRPSDSEGTLGPKP